MTEHLDKTPVDLVIFGATGDLATRKLLPALYNAIKNDNLDQASRILLIGRRNFSKQECCAFIAGTMAANIGASSANDLANDKVFTELCAMLDYVQMDLTENADYVKLATIVRTDIVNVFYLSTAPELFTVICKNLTTVKLNHSLARIVLEKPLGHDVASANEINDFVNQFFAEKQIYRIDHYLGKESVQNLLAIRFGNTLFEALWRRQWIDSIQITIAEDLGVESRGEFYDNTGALRDMLQNHLLQLLCIVAMEPPPSLDADIIRDEKLKVLRSLKPLTQNDVLTQVVRGQYKDGAINGKPVVAYRNEQKVVTESMTETFVAVRAEIMNWRWANVPFYLRTGKRLQSKTAEIVVQFKDIPCKIFPSSVGNFANRLIIKLQPQETVQLYFLAKQPGDTNTLQPVYLDLDFAKMFSTRRMESYERLLLDVIRGNLTLFVRRDEQLAAWKWVEPILNTWKQLKIAPKLYSAGTWGPTSSSTLLASYGTMWHEELNA